MAKTTQKAESATKTTETVKIPAAVEETKAVKEVKPAAKAKAAPKTTKAKPVAKAVKTADKAAPTIKVFVEYQGRQMDMDAILEIVKAAAGKSVKTLEVYVKPEDGAAYYVVNGKDGGKAEL